MEEQNTEAEQVNILYAVRLTQRARRDVDAAHDRFVEISGEAIADAWEDGLYQAIATLARLPHRFPTIPEKDRFKNKYNPIRQLVYQRRPGAPSYRILYIVHDGKPEDAPFVNIIHIRHAAARPITIAEAKAITSTE